MSKFDKVTQKSIRVVLPLSLYEKLKSQTHDYGDISRLVRHLLLDYLKSGKILGPISRIGEDDDRENSAPKT